MLSAFISAGRRYPAMPLVGQPVHKRSILPGPLVLGKNPRNTRTPTTDRRPTYMLLRNKFQIINHKSQTCHAVWSFLPHSARYRTDRTISSLIESFRAWRTVSTDPLIELRVSSVLSCVVYRSFTDIAKFIDSSFIPKWEMSTVSRRSEPSSRTALIGEQPNPWELLHPQDAMSRHRGAKPGRRYGRSGQISLLSPE